MQHDRVLAQADHWLLTIVCQTQHFQHVFHLADVVVIEICHHLPFSATASDRGSAGDPDGFSSYTRTSLRLTASSATGCMVPTGRPSRGLLHTMAMNRCFWLPSSTTAAPGRRLIAPVPGRLADNDGQPCERLSEGETTLTIRGAVVPLARYSSAMGAQDNCTPRVSNLASSF